MKKNKEKRIMPNNNKNVNNTKKNKMTSRRYNVYNKTNHNT